MSKSNSVPPGVDLFDGECPTPSPLIVDLTGGPKTGKTHWAVHSPRPLYIVSFDPNPNLDDMLVKAEQDGCKGDVFKKVVPPVSLDKLDRVKAAKIIKDTKDFGDWAAEQGNNGTFVVDGAAYLKGYFEFAILGTSSTLGSRPEAGKSTGVSTFDYAKSNGAIKDFLATLAQGGMDVVMSWEGREKWVNSEPIGIYRSSSPKQTGFVSTVFVETTPVFEPVYETTKGVKTKIGTNVKHRLRIGPNSDNLALQDKEMPITGLQQLKDILQAFLPKGDAKKQVEAMAMADAEPLPRADGGLA